MAQIVRFSFYQIIAEGPRRSSSAASSMDQLREGASELLAAGLCLRPNS